MATTLTVRNQVPNSASGVRFPHALEAIADGTYRFANRGGKVKLILYMPASSTVHFVFDSVPDKFGREEDAVATDATAGANPEIRVVGPFSPALFNQRTGADKDYVTFTVSATTGAIKVAALYGA